MNKFFRRLITLILLGIIIFSAFNIFKILKGYKENENVYKEINKIVTVEDEEIKINKDKYASLKEINEDYLFWIKVPETKINYPVVKSYDNEDYLYKNFKGEYNSGGSIFLDARNSSEEDNNIIIHGHNMKDDSMFGTLSNFLDSKFVEENNRIYIHLENKVLEYEVFSVYINIGDFNPYIANFNNDEEFEEYINTVMKKSYHNLNFAYDDNKDILTLSTCTNATGDERTIVHAKLISTEDI